MADNNLWDELADKLLKLIETTQDKGIKKQLALTYGEVLSRSGNFEDAYRQLYLLKEQYGDELLGTYANYLLFQLRSVHENPIYWRKLLSLHGVINKQYAPLSPIFPAFSN